MTQSTATASEHDARSQPAPGAGRRGRPRAIALGLVGVGLVVIGALVWHALSHRELHLAYSSPAKPETLVAPLGPGQRLCQAAVAIPAGAAQLKIGIDGQGAPALPSLALSFRAGTRVLLAEHVARGAPQGLQTFPVPLSKRSIVGTTLCVRNRGSTPVSFMGQAHTVGAITRRGRKVHEQIALQWYRPGAESWKSLRGVMAKRFAVAKPGWMGSWTFYAVFVLVAIAWLISLALLLARRAGVAPVGWRRLRVPAAAWACAAVAFANALAFAVLVPPFQVPDEPAHAAYAQHLGETGHLPPPSPVSTQEQIAIDAVNTFGTVFDPVHGRTPWLGPQDELVQRALSADAPRGDGGAAGASIYPPLYYAVEAVPYRLSSGTFLDRLFAMRAFSALFAAISAAGVVLFLRELLPRSPGAWAVGGLVAAFQPMFAFMTGSVNNDAMLIAVACLSAFVAARVLRRGLTMRLALAAGLLAAAGMLCKTAYAGLLPAFALAQLLAFAKLPSGERWRGLRALGAGVAVVVVPAVAFLLVNAASQGRSLSTLGGGLFAGTAAADATLSGQAHYLWEFYRPRTSLLAMPVWRIWFQQFVGAFGTLDTFFRPQIYQKVAVVWLLVGAATVVVLLRARAALARYWREALVCVVAVLGLLLVLGIAGYRNALATHTTIEQGRYLLPLLPFYALVPAVLVHRVGSRWGIVVGVPIVMFAMAFSLFSVLLVAGRFYG